MIIIKRASPAYSTPADQPVDDRRRADLRHDPEVAFYERPDPDHRWSFEPALTVDQPVSARELLGRDDDEFEPSER